MKSKVIRDTAINRKSISRPMHYLYDNDLLIGRHLDYGCGKGFDARFCECASYDPLHQPEMPSGIFDTITCIYVLNVIADEHERLGVLSTIQSKLSLLGVAYIAVRRDRSQFSRFQYWIELPFDSIVCNSGFEIYRFDSFSLLS